MLDKYSKVNLKRIQNLKEHCIAVISLINNEIKDCRYSSKKEELERFLFLLQTYNNKLNEAIIKINKRNKGD